MSELTGTVIALGGCERPEDALKRLNEALVHGLKGVILVTIPSDDTEVLDLKTFGIVTRGDLTYVGAALTREAFEE